MRSNSIYFVNFFMFKLLFVCLLATKCFAIEPERVIAISPSVNSIVKALGAQRQIVGVDMQSISLYPESVSDIGYMRALNLEGILSLKPDLCLAAYEAAPRKVIDELDKYKVKTVTTTKIRDLNSVSQNIFTIGNALGKTKAATALNAKIMQEANTAINLIPPHQKKLRALFLLQISPNQVFALGQRTHGDWWLNFIALDNVIKFGGMKPLSKEEFMVLKPDLILFARVNSRFQLPYKAELDKHIHTGETRLISVNSQILDGFGADFGLNAQFLVKEVYHAK